MFSSLCVLLEPTDSTTRFLSSCRGLAPHAASAHKHNTSSQARAAACGCDLHTWTCSRASCMLKHRGNTQAAEFAVAATTASLAWTLSGGALGNLCIVNTFEVEFASILHLLRCFAVLGHWEWQCYPSVQEAIRSIALPYTCWPWLHCSHPPSACLRWACSLQSLPSSEQAICV